MKLQRELQDLQRKKKYRGWTIKGGGCGCLQLYKGNSYIFLGICSVAIYEDYKTFWVNYGINDRFNPFANSMCIDGGGAPVYEYWRLSDVDWDWDKHEKEYLERIESCWLWGLYPEKKRKLHKLQYEQDYRNWSKKYRE